MVRLINRVRHRQAGLSDDRGGPMLELAVVFGIVAIIAVVVISLASESLAPQVSQYIQGQVNEALGGEGGGAENDGGGTETVND
ncbi:hypothetical protein J4H86_08670 [Spiractinospora alimapuensis]|uniref:hypothetical protein n=1 Tax=Spiractinospora alimapuensis TaxID=2820884 RepID=UPI001F41E77D|nr:hypothetical protein [Spiractinospora alimapuensis]QVQ53769.1 hypothetical protein J4H86_08670 [Spiractinospora alimapuensis]